jgi:hypothetical protein
VFEYGTRKETLQADWIATHNTTTERIPPTSRRMSSLIGGVHCWPLGVVRL